MELSMTEKIADDVVRTVEEEFGSGTKFRRIEAIKRLRNRIGRDNISLRASKDGIETAMGRAGYWKDALGYWYKTEQNLNSEHEIALLLNEMYDKGFNTAVTRMRFKIYALGDDSYSMEKGH